MKGTAAIPTRRQTAIARALSAGLPRAPFVDAETIRAAAGAPHLRDLNAEAAFWLAAVAHIRHQHTDYDVLRDEGYDREAARHFVLDEINAVLGRWGASRRLDPEASEDDAQR